MSGIVQNNILRSSGTIAAAASGINWVSTVVTASTLTAEAGNGYFINTTSNACTITLPGSAEAGDQIVFVDYLRTWGTNAVTLDQGSLKYQAGDTNPVYDTAGETVNIVYSGATNGWIPLDDDAVADVPVAPETQKGIFAYGTTGSDVSLSNLVNSSGVVAADVTGVGTVRIDAAATTYGGDKGIVAFGLVSGVGKISLSNLISSSGVVAADVTGVGTARNNAAAAKYGVGLALFAYGISAASPSDGVTTRNLVNSSGVIATDASGAGTTRSRIAAVGYGGDKAIFAYGWQSTSYGSGTNLSNLISNTGVMATDTAGVGTARYQLAATSYGTGLGIFAYGSTDSNVSLSNKVSISGVIAADVTGVGSARQQMGACAYGADKGIFAYGSTGSNTAVSNLVSNTGVVATDVSGVGTARYGLVAAGFSYTA